MERTPSARLIVAVGLVAAVLVVYAHVGAFAFLDWDDGRYVVENPHVRDGLSAAGVVWAFTTFHASNWHPLTWLSHMTDVALFGLDPGWHHRINVLWHAVNAALLFLMLRASTGSVWRSAFAAALFAVHPLNVESVAWVAERKNVLSTFFWLLAMAASLRQARRPGLAWSLVTVGALAAGLLAKPMLVTLPIALVLWDFWPLRRIAPEAFGSTLAARVAEKTPLFVLSVVSAVVTLVAQARGGALSTLEAIPFPARGENAILSYAAYLGKAVWPASLAAFYPHPAVTPPGISSPHVVWSTVLLLGITVLVAWQWKPRPYLLVGWLWYLLTLLPVIGLVHVGRQGMADRYTYVPLIGLFIAVAWAVPAPAPTARVTRWALAIVASAALFVLAARAADQVTVWRDTETLFTHATKVVPGNWLAWKNVGTEHYRHARFDRAIVAFENALRTRADDAETWTDLAASYAMIDRHEAAARALREVLRLHPEDQEALANLVVASMLSSEPDLAKRTLARLRELNPARAATLVRAIDAARPER